VPSRTNCASSAMRCRAQLVVGELTAPTEVLKDRVTAREPDEIWRTASGTSLICTMIERFWI